MKGVVYCLSTDCVVACREDYSRKGCLLIIILSHGDETSVYGADGKVKYEELLTPIRQASSNRLKHIPKLLLMQVRP